MNLPDLKMVFRVLDQASAPLRRIQNRLAAMSSAARRDMGAAGKAVRNVGVVVAGGVAALTSAAVAQRGATADALNALESLDIQNLPLMRRAALDFSNTWSGTTRDQVLEAAYRIKSGIDGLSDDAVASTTTMAGLTAKATRGMVDEMAKTFAVGHGIYRRFFETDQQYAEQFGAGIAAATKAFQTDGGRMARAISSLGAEASVANVPLAEQLSVLGMLQQTMEPSEAGTSYRAFMASLGKVTKDTGVRFLDAQGKALPMVEILDKFHRLLAKAPDKAQAWTAITEVFGREEAVKVLKLLIDKQEKLGRQIDYVSAASKQGAVFTERMARVMNKGEGAGWAKIVQVASNLAEVLGKALGPGLLPVLERTREIIVSIQGWVEENPRLTRAIMTITFVLGGLAAVLGAVTVAMAAFNVAAWTNPVTWIAVAIGAAVAAIIAAGVALYLYWDEFMGWWVAYWDQWGDTIIVAATTVGTILFGPVGMIIGAAALIMNHWDKVGPYFEGLFNGIAMAFSAVYEWIAEKIKMLTDWLPDWVKEKLGLKMEAKVLWGMDDAWKGAAEDQARKHSRDIQTWSADIQDAERARRADRQARATGINDFFTADVADSLRKKNGERPRDSKFSGKLQIEIKNGRGVVTNFQQTGDADIDVYAGSLYAPV